MENYKKLSALRKVTLLEETVLSGDMAKLEEVITGCKEFEYTARALGMACRYGTPEMVQRLIQAGASFSGGGDSSLKAKYDSYGRTSSYFGYGGGTTERHFERMAFADSIQDYDEFGDFRNAPKLLVNGKEREPALEQVRMENLRLLCKNKEKTHCDTKYLLYTALIEGKTAWTALLRECGVKLGSYIETFTSTQNSDKRACFIQALASGKPGKRTALLSSVMDVLTAEKQKLAVSLSLVQAVVGNQALMLRVLTEGDCSSLKGPELLREIVANGTSGTLAYCLEHGWLKSKTTRDKLIEQSIAAQHVEHTAVLLEYKNRTADLAKELAAEDARNLKELTADPDSAFMLRKLWATQKRGDGTLVITGYKGNETEVTVPAKIGKAAVTAIGDYAFSPDASRLTGERKDSRRAIAKVTIPEGILEIGARAFYDCAGLTQIDLPGSLKDIGNYAFCECKLLERVCVPKGVGSIGRGVFQDCVSLTTVQLPKGLKSIGDDAFRGCVSLAEITLPDSIWEIGSCAFDGCVSLAEITLPDNLRAINNYAFRGCASLTTLALPDKLRDIGFGVFWNCPNLTVRAPAGSYAEQYAQENNIKFEAL